MIWGSTERRARYILRIVMRAGTQEGRSESSHDQRSVATALSATLNWTAIYIAIVLPVYKRYNICIVT